MYILLSSDYSPRYKQDILRCLAAPINASVQFRYDKVHLSGSVMKAISEAGCSGPALICSVASKGAGPLTLVPVRIVEILDTREHGSTVSVLFSVKEIVYAEAAKFTTQMDQLSNGESPRKESEETPPEGKYFFEVARLPDVMQQETSLAIWERTVTQVRQQNAYEDEPFFYSVVGVQKQGERLDAACLHPMPVSLSSGQSFDLLIYHFQPRGGPKPNSKLELVCGSDIEIEVPPDTSVDSRYDLKVWNCKTVANKRTSHWSWIRIRAAATWDLDIPVRVAGNWLRWLARAIVAGVLISVPSIAAIATQSLSDSHKYALYGIAILAGVLAGLAATFKIDRLD